MHALWLICCLLTAPYLPSTVTPYNHPSPFILSLTRDSQGDVWVGTESDGIWRCDPEGRWTRFTTRNGLDENSGTALLCDSQGRIWAGHRKDGVSVFNGQQWENYTPLNGPLGGRVFALACSPINGDVWMATDRGLARWSQSLNTWSYYTRSQGLPEDQATCLAFTANGTLVVGTQANGLAIGSPDDDYHHWRLVPGPAQVPDAPQGHGLPSPLINALLVTRGGAIYAGTDDGLAGSIDGGHTWRYLRGADWLAKAQQQTLPPTGPLPAPKVQLLTEDYVTSLAEDSSGLLWIGHRHTGVELYDPRSGLHAPLPNLPLFDYVRAVLVPAGISPWIGGYGGGIFAPGPAPVYSHAPAQLPAFPASAAAPSAAELAGMASRIEEYNQPLAPGSGEFLGDDWNTQGDWVGRYGAQYAILYGMQTPSDVTYSSNPEDQVTIGVGPHTKGYSGVFTYVSTLYSHDLRFLWDPMRSSRRDAEVNDGSWQNNLYPITYQGPDLWVTVQVPSGLQQVSFYFNNDDGHNPSKDGLGDNRLRDYTLEMMPGSASPSTVSTQKVLAETRVFDFYEGVYKRFLVQGPATFCFKIGRNNSFVTKLQGVFIDAVPVPLAPLPLTDEASRLVAAQAVWKALDIADGDAGGAALDSTDRVLAYRAAAADGASPELLADWRHRLGFWTAQDRAAFTGRVAEAPQL